MECINIYPWCSLVLEKIVPLDFFLSPKTWDFIVLMVNISFGGFIFEPIFFLS